MREPHASEFRHLIQIGAGARDIHGVSTETGYVARATAHGDFLARELARVKTHERALCPILERFADRARIVLDVGCSTGGTTVAVARSALRPDLVVGVDPDELSLRAAEVRARGECVDARTRFVQTRPGARLPFDDETFDLTVCVSVFEFVPSEGARRMLASEMRRVTRDGGLIFVATPNPLRLREVHARRWLGDLRPREGLPWAPLPWTLRSMFAGCERVSLASWLLHRRIGVRLPEPLAAAVAFGGSWQKLLVRKGNQRMNRRLLRAIIH